MSNSQFFTYIDSLNVSKGWKKTFKKFHIVYHDNYSNGKNINYHFWRMSSDFKNMPSKDRRYFLANFNFFALILGPIYYLIKKMFLKGAILGLIFAILCISHVTRILIVPLLIYCAYFANRDYYIEKVLKNKQKEYNALLLNDPPDKLFICDILAKPYNFLPFVFYVIFISSVLGIYFSGNILSNYVLQDYVESVPVVCSGEQNCKEYILGEIKEVSGLKNKEELSKKYYIIAAAYFGYNDIYNAINSLNLALEMDPHNINALYFRGSLHYKEKRYAQAMLDYKAILKLVPNAYFIRFYEGRCFYQLGMYENASKSFKIAAKKGKKPSYYEYWGYAELKNNNKSEAVNILKKAQKMYSKEQGVQSLKKASELEKYIKSLESAR